MCVCHLGGLRKENTRQAEDILLMYTSLVGPPGPQCPGVWGGGGGGGGGLRVELVRRLSASCGGVSLVFKCGGCRDKVVD